MFKKLNVISVIIITSICMTSPRASEHFTDQRAVHSIIELSKSKFYNSGILPITSTPLYGSETDWCEIIDSTWGEGAPTEEKLRIFDMFWETIDHNFACFQGLDIEWDDLRARYRPEIEGGVSRGRFCAIMNHLALTLRESHTAIIDTVVNYTYPQPGIPLMLLYTRKISSEYANHFSGHFGAGLSPLPDSTLLVYNTVESHPLGLRPGDIVLGYDGIPWHQLLQELLEAQLPIYGSSGSTESSYTHILQKSAGLNWHLFNTIDVVKYDTGDTLHLDTSPLINQDMEFVDSESMDIPGVPKPDIMNNDPVSYGIIEGTKIGYIYVWIWYFDADSQFYEAVYDLLDNYETIGLIIDIRNNTGGNMFLFDKGLSLLFNSSVSTIGFASRCNPNDHFAMCNAWGPEYYELQPDPTTYYDRPIAVLIGPLCISAGDMLALWMKFHPKCRFFGKPTMGAFNGPTGLSLENEDWRCRYAEFEAYLADDPEHYLTREELNVDVPVWLEPDDVVQGLDTVVEEAKAWILNQPHIRTSSLSLDFGVVTVCGSTSQTLTIYNDGFVTLEVNPLSSSDPQFEVSSKFLSIAGSGSTDVEIIFTPRSENSVEASLTLLCNDSNRPQPQINLYGVGILEIEIQFGDVNRDSVINVLDVLSVVNHILGTAEFTDTEVMCRADCNADGQVNVLDALGIVNVILGIGECET